MYIDSHCHLNSPELKNDLAGIRERMRVAQVEAALIVCCTLEDFDGLRQTADFDPSWYCSVGVHPDYQEVIEPSVDALLSRAQDQKVIAIGETGLDFYRNPDAASWQIPRFITHIQAARLCKKPLIVHTRAASADTIRVLAEQGARDCGGVMHCFTESWQVAQAALDLGFYISFSGIVTFKNADDIREVARKVPLDRLLIETDAPYLAPVPLRGRTNEPSFVTHVAAKIAAERNIEISALAQASKDNFFNLFGQLN